MRLITRFVNEAREHPAKIALITEKNQLSYVQLLDLVSLFDARLTAAGVKPGDCVVFDVKRGEFAIAMAFVLSLRSLTVIYASEASALENGVAFDWYVGLEPSVFVSQSRQLIIGPERFAAIPEDAFDRDWTPAGEGGAFVFRSSGSTGKIKLIRTDEAARLRDMMTTSAPSSVPPGRDRVLSALTPDTGWSMNINLRALLLGSSIVTLSEERDKIMQHIDLYGVTSLFATPLLVRQMFATRAPGQFLHSLCDVRLGGAKSNESLLRSFAEICGANIWIGYGSAEIGGLAGLKFDPEVGFADGCIGTLYRDDIEVLFFDDDMNLMPGTTEGIVGFRLRDPATQKSYMSAQGPTGKSGFQGDCYFPGEIMRREGDTLFLLGRLGNLVNLGGNKFSLDAIQSAVQQAADDTHIAVICEPLEDGDERIVAVTRKADGLTLEALNAALAARFEGLSIGRHIEMDEIPVTDTGKTDVQRLKSLLGFD